MGTIWRADRLEGVRSKYLAVMSIISDAVDAGQLLPGAQLPPVRKLAFELGITPGTVARAYSGLHDAGVLDANVGRGTFVKDVSSAVPHMPQGSKCTQVYEENKTLGEFNFRLTRLPEIGQSAIFQDAITAASARQSFVDIMDYPTRARKMQAHQAVLDQLLQHTDIGSIHAQDVFLTHGGQASLVAVFQAVLREASPVVFVDAMTYEGFARAAWQCRAKIVHVPWDEEGPCIETMRTLAQRHRPKLYCTMSPGVNPTTKRISEGRMSEIVELARLLDFDILDDHCNLMLGAACTSFRALAPDRSWHVGSISKFFSPSLRIGYAIPAEGKHGDMMRSSTSYANFGLPQLFVDQFEALIMHPKFLPVCAEIRLRFNTMLHQVADIFPSNMISWANDVPFFMLHLPQTWRAGALCRTLERQKVLLRSPEEFSYTPERLPNLVRVALNGRMSDEQFAEAMYIIKDQIECPMEDNAA